MSVAIRTGRSNSVLAMLIIMAVVATAGTASAVSLTDIPEALAETTGINAYAAEILLSMAAILSVTLALAFAGAPMPAYIAVDMVMLVFFIAIGWLDYWVIIVVVLLAVGVMAISARGIIFPGGG